MVRLDMMSWIVILLICALVVSLTQQEYHGAL